MSTPQSKVDIADTEDSFANSAIRPLLTFFLIAVVGMGVLPLEFANGASWQSLGLTGEEIIDIPDLSNDLQPRSTITVTATSAEGKETSFPCVVRIDTPVEMQYYQNGGILHTVLRNLAK